jgi:aminoglycoside phosphotransferase (APT) family kinase protein
MQCLSQTDVPVPEIRWLEKDTSVLGRPFYVMKKIEGEIPPDVPFYHTSGVFADATPERREKMWWNGVETLARIHTLDWEGRGLALLGVPEGDTGPLDRQLDYYERFLEWARAGQPEPILEAALGWLKENRYVPKRVSLCWGDARLPNLIFRDDEVVGVLDWEMAFLGDPEADLAWWLFLDWHHSQGSGTPRLEGFPSREETVRRYEELTGQKTDQLFCQEVMAALRFGVIMVSIYRNLQGRGPAARSPEGGTDSVITRRLASLLDLPSPAVPNGETS